jgi:predicted phage tail protein
VTPGQFGRIIGVAAIFIIAVFGVGFMAAVSGWFEALLIVVGVALFIAGVAALVGVSNR